MLDEMPSGEDDGSDTDLLFSNRGSVRSPVRAENMVIYPKQSSESSGISALSRRSSTSSAWSAGSGVSPRQTSSSSVNSSRSDDSDKVKEIKAFHTRHLRHALSDIPDNSYHSTVTEEPSRCSTHGNEEERNEEERKENLNSIREDLEMQLLLRTASTTEEEYVTVPSAPVHSPVEMKLEHKSRSFLAPVPRDNYPLRAVSPEPQASTQVEVLPPADTLDHDDADSFRLLPMNKDLSLEDNASVLPTDLSMDMESLARSGSESHQLSNTTLNDVPMEFNADLLHQTRVNPSRPTVMPTLLSMDLDPLPQEMPLINEDIHQPMEDVLCDLPHEANDELRCVQAISRPTSANSGCHTTSTGSSSEDMGHMIRSRMLDGSDFDSNCDSNSATISETNSSEKGSVVESSTPYQRLDDTVMEDRSQASSTDSSYHFVNLPQELQSDHVSMDVDDDSDRDSEVATACSSDQDIAHLEELYSEIFSDEDDTKAALITPTSSSEGESGALSMLGLFKDGESCHSSVVSFDSTDFLEDEQFGQFDEVRSKGYCSISMHDITTIHEEEDDDIADEDEVGLPADHNLPPMPLNGELHLRRLELVSQGTSGTGTFSSVTDDSYMGGMSFDSTISEQVNSSPRGVIRKFVGWKNGINIDLSKHEDFTNGHTLDNQGHPQAFNDESSQFTYEDSHVSFAESACSYDSFSSESVKYMVDILKEEAERRKSKIKERIAMIRESTDRVSYTTEYVSSRLMKMSDEDSTLT